MAYATYTDVENRWRTLKADERTKATTLLSDAATMLDGLVTVDPLDTHQMAVLKLVSCNMVIRAMLASESDAFGIDSLNATMGPFGQTAKFANPSGDMYLTKLEKRMLGVTSSGKGRILHPAYGEDDEVA